MEIVIFTLPINVNNKSRDYVAHFPRTQTCILKKQDTMSLLLNSATTLSYSTLRFWKCVNLTEMSCKLPGHECIAIYTAISKIWFQNQRIHFHSNCIPSVIKYNK